MRSYTLLLSGMLIAGAACTRPPPDRPGVEDQLGTTPRTPAQEPTVSPPSEQRGEWPQAEPIGPGLDDPDIMGTSEPPVGRPDPDEAPR